ncbi:hypothetical protein, partial [Bradyrhizobium uaiense]
MQPFLGLDALGDLGIVDDGVAERNAAAGPKGSFSSTYGDGVGIAAASKNKEAAYLLCQWVVSKGQGAR